MEETKTPIICSVLYTVVCTNILNNPHLFECIFLNNGESPKYKYEDLLNGTLHEKKIIMNIMKKNIVTYRKITLAARADV